MALRIKPQELETRLVDLYHRRRIWISKGADS